MTADSEYPKPHRITVVTPTMRRAVEVAELLDNLSAQTVLPYALILVDGAPAEEDATEVEVASRAETLPYRCRYIRHGGGTAIQRNVGIDAALGDAAASFIAFVDDDIRLEPDFFERILAVFNADPKREVGGIAGYITNQYLDPTTSRRWRWYRRLRLFKTYEPGHYDFASGYPINRYLQPPHDSLRLIDCMGAGCALWRREVFEEGLRFDEFFRDYGVMEDAHLALRAGRRWKLMEAGQAHCIHLRSPGARPSVRQVARKTAVNYRFLFIDIVPNRTWEQELRFWRVQVVDLFRLVIESVRTLDGENWLSTLGKLEGIFMALRLGSKLKRTAR